MSDAARPFDKTPRTGLCIMHSDWKTAQIHTEPDGVDTSGIVGAAQNNREQRGQDGAERHDHYAANGAANSVRCEGRR